MPDIHPPDAHNDTMRSHVHPEDWQNPVADGRYNLVVVGGGPAGLVAALGAAALGGRVALIERRWLGGDCLVSGCVPSKALLASAHAAQRARDLHRLGVTAGPVEVDFARVMERMRQLRAELAVHDSAARLRDAGVDVYLGSARFTGKDSVEVAGQTLSFARAILATGAGPLRPAIPGLESVDILDNERVFELTERPAKLVVIGAGPIGCELGQAFARLGSDVTLVEQGPAILAADDRDAAAVVENQLEADGITLRVGARVVEMAHDAEGYRTHVELHGQREVLVSDAVLLAVGRRPNVHGLGLDVANVRYSDKGVHVDEYLQTSNPQIFAAGDVVAEGLRFTHAADAMARVALQNALFFGFRKPSALVVPWVTYTQPELAHIGIDQGEASRRHDVSVFEAPLARNDRSVLEGTPEGFARVYADSSGLILGATIVGEHAGELIGTLTFAMQHGLGLPAIQDTIFPYPTRSLVLRRVASDHAQNRLTPTVASALRALLSWRR